MRLYADSPAVRARQLVVDGLTLLWCIVWIKLAWELRQRVLELQGPGEQLERAGTSFAANMGAAADTAHRIPFAGGSVSSALNRVASAGDGLAGAGSDEQSIVASIALLLFVVVAALPVSWALLRWLPGRLRWMRDSAAARSLSAHQAGIELLAHRAVARRPLPELARLPALTVELWRAGDEGATREIAGLELAALGLTSARPRAQVGTAG